MSAPIPLRRLADREAAMTELFIRVDALGRHQCYRLVNGLYKLDVGPAWKTPREAIDYSNADQLAGLPGRRPNPDLAGLGAASRDEVVAPSEAADHASCERCGRPLPPGSRPQRRTCSTACRVALARAHGSPETHGVEPVGAPLVDVTVSSPSEADSLRAPAGRSPASALPHVGARSGVERPAGEPRGSSTGTPPGP